jgi:hypothetical protein
MPSEESERTKVLLTQYQALLEVYKQHFDLFLKGVTVYLAAMSAIAGFAIAKETSANIKLLLSALIPCGSLIAFFGFLISRRWVAHLQKSLESIEAELRIQPFPFSGPKGIILTMILAALAFFIAGCVYFVFTNSVS